MRAPFDSVIICIALQVFAPVVVLGDTVSLPALRDGFVRQLAPTLNYGGAGNLCVAGTDSVNVNDEPRGRFDSLIEFDSTDAVAALNVNHGPGGWAILSVELRFSELGAPQNPLFPRGVGITQCAWLPGAAFTEGSGTPQAPVAGEGDLLTWDHLQSLLAGTSSHILGQFANAGIDGNRTCALAVNGAFAAALRAGGILTLHLFPLTPEMGCTFIARNFPTAALRPSLIMTIEPIVAGDLNCDNQLDVQDVPAFVLALVAPHAYTLVHGNCDIVRADLDGNGQINGRDVGRLVELLTTP